MPKVTFLKGGKPLSEVEVPSGTNLRQAAIAHGVALHHDPIAPPFMTPLLQYANCHGLGMCGTCHVFVKKGMENLSKPGVRERARLALATFSIGHESETRLSCQASVEGDVEVEVQPKMNLFGERFWE